MTTQADQNKAHPLFPFPKTMESPFQLCKRPLVTSMIFSYNRLKKKRLALTWKNLNSSAGLRRITGMIEAKDSHRLTIRECLPEGTVEVSYIKKSPKEWALENLCVYLCFQRRHGFNVIVSSETLELTDKQTQELESVANLNTMATTFLKNYWMTYPEYASHGNIVVWQNWYDSVKAEPNIADLLRHKLAVWKGQRNTLVGAYTLTDT